MTPLPLRTKTGFPGKEIKAYTQMITEILSPPSCQRKTPKVSSPKKCTRLPFSWSSLSIFLSSLCNQKPSPIYTKGSKNKSLLTMTRDSLMSLQNRSTSSFFNACNIFLAKQLCTGVKRTQPHQNQESITPTGLSCSLFLVPLTLGKCSQAKKALVKFSL